MLVCDLSIQIILITVIIRFIFILVAAVRNFAPNK